MKHALTLLLLVAPSITACNIEDSSEANDDLLESTNRAEQPFTGYIGGKLDTTTPSLTIWGSGVGACFLNGVRGNMAANTGGGPTTSFIRTFNFGGTYYLDINPVAGRKLGASFGCVTPATAVTAELSYSTTVGSPTAPVFLAASSTNRQCFITKVSNPNLISFIASTDTIQVFQNGSGDWYIGGTGNASGQARCITVSNVLSAVTLSGPQTAYDLGLTANGKMCFLRGVGGNFRSNVATDAQSWIYTDTIGHWRADLAPGNYATAVCAD